MAKPTNLTYQHFNPLFIVQDAKHLTDSQGRLMALDKVINTSPKPVDIEVRGGDSAMTITPTSKPFRELMIFERHLGNLQGRITAHQDALTIRINDYDYVVKYKPDAQR